MESFYENSGEERESIKRFEQAMKSGDMPFFDLGVFEFIIAHYLETGDLKKAEKACKLGIEQYPYTSQLKIDLAQIFTDQAKFKPALNILDEVEVYQPTDPDLLTLKGTLLFYLERFEESKEYLERVLPLAEAKDHILFFLGMVNQSLNEIDQALECFKLCLLENPSHSDALFEMTSCLEMFERLEEGVAFYKEFIDNDPYASNAWYNLGIVYDKLKDFISAVEAYEYAVAIEPKFSSAYYNLGLAQMELGEYSKAIESLRETVNLEEWEDADLYYNLGVCYEKLDNPERALVLYQKCVGIDQYYDECWYAIGTLLDKQEKWFESIHFFKKAAETDPQNAQYMLALAEAEYKTGNVVSSLEAYTKAAEIAEGYDTLWLDWSFIYYEQGDYEKAISLIEEGLEELPESAELYYRLTVYLISKGNYKEAFIYLENGLILDFEKHVLLFEFFPELETQKALMKIIDQFNNGDVR